MKTKLSLWQLAGFIFTGVAGSLLHFAYNWSNQSLFFAPFSAVNESVWEHLKLLFVPMFVFALIENVFLGHTYENFWCVKLLGILLGILLIPILYYSYTGVFGINLDWINITIFFLAGLLAFLLELFLFPRLNCKVVCTLWSLFFLCVLALVFVIFTFMPPNIPLFEVPK